jgi:hypothetical protein
MKKKTEKKLVVGWREWVCLPELCIPSIKAKVDTGARTSSLHAFQLDSFTENGTLKVRFGIHPLQKTRMPEIICVADVIDERMVSDSGGHREKRFVIQTPIRLGDREWPIEITLTNREDMTFRMLVGRTAMRGSMVVDPGRSFLAGRELAAYYKKKQR